jgi:hemerythrin superfamily protein
VVIKKKAAAIPLKASAKPSAKASTELRAKHKPARVAAQPDATSLLRADHKLVEGLFAEYAKTHAIATKKKLVTQICAELIAHVQVEEEIFYPAIKRALKQSAGVPEAEVEHSGLKALIAEVEHAEPEGELFEARIKVLSEYLRHHVKEEQDEMFPKARTSRLDLVALGEKMSARKAELLAQLSSQPRQGTELPQNWHGR